MKKLESSNQARMKKVETNANPADGVSSFRHSVIRHSDLILVSGFVIRISTTACMLANP